MSQISATSVNEVRKLTGRGMMECKSALTEAGGDVQKAVDILRKKGGINRPDRVTGEGRVAAFVDPDRRVGALVEVLTESAPVAKSEPFVQLADDVARQVAVGNPGSIDELLSQPLAEQSGRTVNDRIAEVIGLIRENMKVNRMVRLEGLLGSYVHHDGTVGVLVQVEGERADPQLLRDVAMHITATRPMAAVREEVPADVIAKEREIAQAQIAADPKNKGKPANILEKVAEGKLKTWYAENVLVDQEFVKDKTKTVGDLLRAAGLRVVRFVRFKVGEAGG
jgi:elongation factor Ts